MAVDDEEPGAPAQHPRRPAAPRRRLRELREHQLLGLRVHDHVRADRPRGRGGRHPRRRRLAREHVDAVHEGAARRDAGLVVEVVGPRGDQEPARGDRRDGPAAGRLAQARAIAIRCTRVGWSSNTRYGPGRRARVARGSSSRSRWKSVCPAAGSRVVWSATQSASASMCREIAALERRRDAALRPTSTSSASGTASGSPHARRAGASPRAIR